MEKHQQLHETLRAAVQFLDSAASQVRDLPLDSTKEHIRLIAGAIANVFQVLHTVEAESPDLTKRYDEPSEEAKMANRRLGEALIEAEDIAEKGDLEFAQSFLERFAESEPSMRHRDIAIIEATRYKLRRDQ